MNLSKSSFSFFAFRSDFVLHLLEQCHDFPDGIRRMLGHCIFAGSSQW